MTTTPSPSVHTFDVPLASGSTSACRYDANSPRAVLVLAHGAGAGQRHPFMTAIASSLAARGITVVTFDFPYMHAGRRLPDRAPVLEACFAAIVEAVRNDGATRGLPLFIGGKSMGGRMATHLGASQAVEAAGIVALGYPLHPPGKPEQPRTAHLPAITWPVLIVQGSRDAFGTPQELEPVLKTMTAPTTLHVVAGGDHSFAVKGVPKPATLDGLVDVVAGWIGRP
jgi:predicted alpha/beta-hydrolase family hydrolase